MITFNIEFNTLLGHSRVVEIVGTKTRMGES